MDVVGHVTRNSCEPLNHVMLYFAPRPSNLPQLILRTLQSVIVVDHSDLEHFTSISMHACHARAYSSCLLFAEFQIIEDPQSHAPHVGATAVPHLLGELCLGKQPYMAIRHGMGWDGRGLEMTIRSVACGC
jgi:hypothetical protein